MKTNWITHVMTTAFLVSILATGGAIGSEGAYVIPRLVAGDIGGIIYTPNLSFKNLSNRTCEGRFELLEGDFSHAKGIFGFNGSTIEDGVLTVILSPGEGWTGKLEKSDAGGFTGFGSWRQEGECLPGRDLALSADVEVGILKGDDQYRIVDQIGFTASATPSERWGFAARQRRTAEAVDSTAFAVVPDEPGPYNWTVDFYHDSGIGKLTRKGTAEGPLSLFIHEVFGQNLAADFTGYVTISADKPLYLEALTVTWGKAIEGGVQYSNFPVRADVSVPHTHEISAEALQMALDRIISDYGAVGISGAVVVHGHLVWAGASGNSFPGTPITSEMYFDIGSIAKNYVAALILRLSEEGLLSLEDYLNQWLPSFRNINSWVTIRQLLNHTSGIFSFTRNPNFWGDVFHDPGRRWTPEQVLDYVLEPYFTPGTSWTYSNSNYTLLGMIAERATGSSLSAALHNWLLEPLGLNHTFLEPEEEVPGTLAHAWFDINGDGEYEDIGGIDRTSQTSAVWAAGGIVATAADVAKWACALFEGEVLTTDSLSEMVDFREIEMKPSPMVGYGLGALKSVVAGREYWGHGGDMIGYTAMMFYAPEERVSMVFLLNQDFLDYAAGVALLEPVIEAIQPPGTVKLAANE